jgi:hypothetical protein
MPVPTFDQNIQRMQNKLRSLKACQKQPPKDLSELAAIILLAEELLSAASSAFNTWYEAEEENGMIGVRVTSELLTKRSVTPSTSARPASV